MKIKGILKCSLGKLLLIFSAIGVAFTALRFYQMLAITDASTGFFTAKNNPTVILFYVLWFVVALGFSVTSYLCNDIPENKFAPQKNIPHAFASLLFGASLVLTAVERLQTLLSGAAGASLLQYVRAQKEWLSLLYCVFAFLGALSLVIDAFAFVLGKDFIAKLKIIRLFPVFWAFCLTIGYFGITVSYIHVSQLMLTIFAGVFLMLFLFEYARFIADIGQKDAAWSLIATGSIAAVNLFASTLPNLFFVISGQSERLVVNCPMQWFNLVGGIYVISALFSVIKNRSLAKIDIKPMAQPVEAVTAPADAAEKE